MTQEIVRELVNGEWVTRPKDQSGGGSVPGTVIPVADPTGATVDTTTYDNPITGSGKLTTLVFPADTAAFAWAIAGDVFPRLVFAADPGDFALLQYGDGTSDPTSSSNPSIGLGGNGVMNLHGNHGMSLALTDVNHGLRNISNVPLQIGTSGATLTSGSGDPNSVYGGNVGDLFVRTDGGALTTIYRCSVAGDAAGATWVGIL